MRWNKLPLSIVLFASILPWVAAFLMAKWVTYIPVIVSLLVYVVYMTSNVSRAWRISYGFLFVFLMITVSVFWQRVNGLGIGSGGLIIIFTLTFIFLQLLRSSHNAVQPRTIVGQISIIYTIHVVFILFELTVRLLGYTDVLVSIAGNASEVAMYKIYNKARFLHYIGFSDMTGLNGLLLGSQSASMVSLFAAIWFAPLYEYNYLPRSGRRFKLRFILSVTAFLVSITMTVSILMTVFLLLLIYVIPLSSLKQRKFQLAFPLFLIIGSSSIIRVVLFNIHGRNDYLTYTTTFMSSINHFLMLNPVEQFFGIGVSASKLGSAGDFGLGMLLLQSGIFIVGLGILSLITIFVHVHKTSKRSKKSLLHNNDWRWLATVNSLIALGWGASLIHYTPAVELGGRELFAFHLAVSLLAVKKMKHEGISENKYVSGK